MIGLQFILQTFIWCSVSESVSIYSLIEAAVWCNAWPFITLAPS